MDFSPVVTWGRSRPDTQEGSPSCEILRQQAGEWPPRPSERRSLDRLSPIRGADVIRGAAVAAVQDHAPHERREEVEAGAGGGEGLESLPVAARQERREAL